MSLNNLSLMDKQQYSLNSASKIYNYYYNLAIKEFNYVIADRLAKIPADYVYNSLMKFYPDCYINEKCCLEYCNDILDSEFNNLSPDFKRYVYNKSFKVDSVVSDGEINIGLKSKRRNLKNKFFKEFNKISQEQENDLSQLVENINIRSETGSSKRKNKNIDFMLKELKLN